MHHAPVPSGPRRRARRAAPALLAGAVLLAVSACSEPSPADADRAAGTGDRVRLAEIAVSGSAQAAARAREHLGDWLQEVANEARAFRGDGAAWDAQFVPHVRAMAGALPVLLAPLEGGAADRQLGGLLVARRIYLSLTVVAERTDAARFRRLVPESDGPFCAAALAFTPRLLAAARDPGRPADVREQAALLVAGDFLRYHRAPLLATLRGPLMELARDLGQAPDVLTQELGRSLAAQLEAARP